MAYELIVKYARTRRDPHNLVDIAISQGRISKIASVLSVGAEQVIDAGGKLVTKSFVNGHLHLCKVYTLTMVGEDALSSYTSGGMGGAMTAIEQAARVKDQYNERWIIKNVRRALDQAVMYGNTHIRAFADTDTRAKLEGVKALLRARDEYKDRIDIQVVAFPQDGVYKRPRS